MTPEQDRLARAVAQVLAEDPAIEAVWLAGSLGRGEGDTFSDVDVLALVRSPGATEVGLRYAGEVHRIAPVVLVNTLFGGRVVNVVTEEWARFDISFVEAAELDRYSAHDLTVLFNKGEHEPPEREPAAYEPAPAAVLAIINEFLRVLGLLVVADGRQEWLLAMSGLEILRKLTLDLMLEENGISPAARGGTLRRNPLLTAEQRQALEGLPPIVADRASLFEANRRIAAIFLPRARRLADRIGVVWPDAFEAATRRSLELNLGLTFAASDLAARP